MNKINMENERFHELYEKFHYHLKEKREKDRKEGKNVTSGEYSIENRLQYLINITLKQEIKIQNLFKELENDRSNPKQSSNKERGTSSNN